MKRLTLKEKRAIVDRFYAGESMTHIVTHDADGTYNPRGLLNFGHTEAAVRWSMKSKVESDRVRKVGGRRVGR